MSTHAVDQLRFVAVDQDDPLAEPLLAELALEYARRYRAPVEGVSTWLRSYPADEFAAPGGAMVIGLVDDRPVTGGAFRRFDADTAELKRIWTDSGHRRRGFARALLTELESLIAARGYRRIYLAIRSISGRFRRRAGVAVGASWSRGAKRPLVMSKAVISPECM